MQVEVVRLGDAKFLLNNQIDSLKKLADEWKQKMEEYTDVAEITEAYFDGRLQSTLHAIERLEQVKASLERRKING